MAKTGVDLIADERKRQVESEIYTTEHDDRHTNCELAQAAAAYAISSTGKLPRAASALWPKGWLMQQFKPKNALRDLVRAGALIAAEIDRIQRSA